MYNNYMDKVIGFIFPSTQFTWSKETRALVSEISTTPQVLRQLREDSFDLGFGIKSHRTGEIAYFKLQEQVKNECGETLKWIFIPTLDSLRKNHKLAGVLVYIYNT